jgi:hypothetical protein
MGPKFDETCCHGLKLHLFQIVCCFGFPKYIYLAKHLDIDYVYIHSKNNVSQKAEMAYNLERIEYLTFVGYMMLV